MADQDINEAFDSIAQIEERLLADGFSEGFESGQKLGEEEGFHLGYHKGAELGAELGFYSGAVKAWLSVGSDVISEKARQSLQKLQALLQKFPTSNVDNVDISSLVDEVRVSFRRTCSLLKTNASYPEGSKLSF